MSCLEARVYLFAPLTLAIGAIRQLFGGAARVIHRQGRLCHYSRRHFLASRSGSCPAADCTLSTLTAGKPSQAGCGNSFFGQPASRRLLASPTNNFLALRLTQRRQILERDQHADGP